MDAKSIQSHVTYISANQTQFQTFVFKVKPSFFQFAVDGEDITSLGCLDTLRELAKQIFLTFYINTGRYPVTLSVKQVDLSMINFKYGQTMNIDSQEMLTKFVKSQSGNLNKEMEYFIQA